MFDIDNLLNFLYVVAFLAAMILPAFQKQRREEARKRAEQQQQAEDIPTVEQRDPADVPEPTVRREPQRAERAPTLAEDVDVARAPADERGAAASVPVPLASATPAASGSAPAPVGGLESVFPSLDLTPLDERIDLTDLDERPLRSEPPARARAGSMAAASGVPRRPDSVPARRAPLALSRAELRRAVIWRELLAPPVTVRSRSDERGGPNG